MSSWAYCSNDDCGAPIARESYTVQDVENQTYFCPHCNHRNWVAHFSMADYLELLEERVKKLEEQIKRCMKV